MILQTLGARFEELTPPRACDFEPSGGGLGAHLFRGDHGNQTDRTATDNSDGIARVENSRPIMAAKINGHDVRLVVDSWARL
jgi:hypothetical protein